MTQTKILPLTNDVMMQMYFTRSSNIEQLKQFLKAVTHLTDDDLTKIQIQNPKLKKDNPEEKDFIVDVNVTTKTGHRINIDMQVENHANFIERMVSYNARNYSSQLKKGDQYDKLREAISIVVVDFPMFDDTDEFFEHILFRRKNEKVFTNAQQFYILDLTKISNEPSDAKEQWAALFKAKSEEELNMLSRSSAELDEAVEKLIELNADEEVRYLANLRIDADMLRNTLEAEARRKVASAMERGHATGHAAGHAAGREEERELAETEKIEKAKVMLRDGLSIETVARYTGLDIMILTKLQKSL